MQLVGTIFLSPEANCFNPFIDQSSVLARAEMARIVNPAREYKILNSTPSKFQLCEQAFTGILGNLKLHGSPSLALSDSRARSDLWSAYQVANLQLNEITASELAIDR